MQQSASVRSFLMAGVAITGAGVIAVNPVQPLISATNELLTTQVKLLAAPSPIDVYSAVFQDLVFNVKTVVNNEFLPAPFPIAANVLTNLAISAQVGGQALIGTALSVGQALITQSPALLVNAVKQLLNGNVLGAVNDVISAALAPFVPLTLLAQPLSQVLTNPIYNIVNVVQALSTPQAVTTGIVGLLGPIISTVGATAAATQNVINALLSGHFKDALSWAVSAPAIVVDGLLNGGYGPVLYTVPDPVNPTLRAGVVAGGLLNPQKYLPNPNPGQAGQVTSPGLVSSFLYERSVVSGALCPSGPCTNPTPPFASTPATASAAHAASVPARAAASIASRSAAAAGNSSGKSVPSSRASAAAGAHS